MKYKVGDRVKITENDKNWDSNARNDANKLPNRIGTIKAIINDHYILEEIRWYWYDKDIEGLASEKFFELESVTRFELMEL